MLKDLLLGIGSSIIYDFGKAVHKQLPKSETVQFVLKNLGAKTDLNDFPQRYVEALVEFRYQGKSPTVMAFFREESIAEAFYNYYYGNQSERFDESRLFQSIKHCIEALSVGDAVKAEEVDVRTELETFWEIFKQKVQENRTVKETEAIELLKQLQKRQSNNNALPQMLTPPPFNFPYVIGRDEELKTVHDRLFAGENFLMLVNGQGGIGKTAFASEYWKRYKQEYKHLAFLFVENGIANALLSLAGGLGLQFTTESTQQQLDTLIKTVSNLNKPCLLILDNANDEKDLNDNIIALRKCQNFHILLTSRLSEAPCTEKYPIGTLSKPFAIQLFKKHYPLLEESEMPLLEEIYDAVGGNTLVLELLAKNLTNFNKLKKRYTLLQLKTDLQNNLLQLSHSKAIHTEYQAKGTGLRHETPEAIILAMYDLTNLTDTEQTLLSIFAVLPAENIEFETLTTLLQDDNLDTPLLTLSQKGWVEQSNTTFKISPVIQDIIKYKNKQRLETDCDILIEVLADKLDWQDNPDYHKDNYKYTSLYAHYAESITKDFSYFQNLIKQQYISMLLERVGSFYKTTGNLQKALDFYTRANELDKTLYRQYPDDPVYKNGLAISYSKLGETHSLLGNLDKALDFFTDETQLFEELYAAYPNNVGFKNGLAISYQFLGHIHSSLGNLDKALDFYEKDAELSKELYAAYPNNVGFKNSLAISYEKLGVTHSSLGKLDKALEFFEEYNRLKKELYDAYPNNVGFKNGLAISYLKLGETYSSLGNLDKALEFFEKDAELSKELYDAYPNNVDFKNCLAVSYYKLGGLCFNSDKAKAKAYFLECKKHCVELTRDFPSYAEFQRNLEIIEEVLKDLE